MTRQSRYLDPAPGFSRIPFRRTALGVVALVFLLNIRTQAATIKVAVASNFIAPVTIIADSFEARTGDQAILIFGSTGKHYAQISNGAPFDVFLAADSERPRLLAAEGMALSGSRFTYAVGKLVLWSPHEDFVDPHADVLKRGRFRHLAVANPKLAPYGRAAREVLQALGLWDSCNSKIVRGENIGQTFQFVESGNAELGFVALSQVVAAGQPAKGTRWLVPQTLYTPIEQQAVLLRDTEPARAFLTFLRSDEARAIIQRYGYGTP